MTETKPVIHQRPTSPHLGIYKPQISTVLSILHRMTGAALAVGTVLLVSWLWAVAYSPECFGWLTMQLATWYGQAALIGWSFAFYFHFANGIRHLFWDAGYGFSLENMHRTGYTVVAFSFIFTAATWICIYSRMGAPS